MEVALWVVIVLMAPAPSHGQEFECVIESVNESIDFSQVEFQSGVYLLGQIPTNGSVKSLCAFGAIQVGMISEEDKASIMGRIFISITREVSTGKTTVLGNYSITQSWGSTKTVCASFSEPVTVMESDVVYIFIQRNCNRNFICPLQVNYRSDEQVLHASVRNRNDAMMRVCSGTLNLVSLNMTSLNVGVIIEAAFDSAMCTPVTPTVTPTSTTVTPTTTTAMPSSAFKALRVSAPIAVLTFLVLTVVVLLLVIAYGYKTIKKKNNALLALSNPHHNGTDQEFEVVESGFSTEYHSLEQSGQATLLNNYERVHPNATIFEHYETAYSVYCMLSKEGSVETNNLPILEEHDYEEPYFEPANEKESLLHQLRNLSIPVLEDEKEIRMLQLLGSGAFGKVYQGLWSHYEAEAAVNKDELVAIKTMEEAASEEDTIKFLQEAAIMGQFNHPNIIRLLGIITTVENHPKMIIELMGKGDLRQHLSQIKPGEGEAVPLELAPTLLSYSRQIANGMMYLAVKSFVHRDLAARNILVSEDCVCKIADFGLSRDLQDQNFYTSHGGKIPVKWTAPEALHYHKYSTASDVWSYGCVLYEIWSLGFKPFHSDSNSEVIKKVSAGFRLPPPPGCPRAIYELMIQCWHPEEDRRPAFLNIMIPLQKPDFQVLKWSDEDTQSSSETARTLGSPLEAGLVLYKDFQRTYFRPAIKQDVDTAIAERSSDDKQNKDLRKAKASTFEDNISPIVGFDNKACEVITDADFREEKIALDVTEEDNGCLSSSLLKDYA